MKVTRKDLLSKKDFGFKMLKLFSLSAIFITLSMAIGTIGYCYYGNLNFIDSFYNASMILTGMGPVDKMPNDSAKLFSSLYALYSGVAFLTSVAVLLSPIMHRALILFHLDETE